MDRGVFFLGATALGAGIGYLVGKSQDDNAPTVDKVFGIWKSRQTAGLVMGTLVGASVAALYLYVELLVRGIVWYGQTAIKAPGKTAAVTLVFLMTVGLLMNAYNSRRRPHRRFRKL